jgi:polysaccharide export outer membrane protein
MNARMARPASSAGGVSGISMAPDGIASLRLMPGSAVTLHVFEEPDLDGVFRIDRDGNISIPLAGTVHLSGLTLRQAEAVIDAKLVQAQVLKDSHVVVDVSDFSAESVVVRGEVASPGRYPILASRKLIDMLAMAGGETQLAGDAIIIHRAGQPEQVTELVRYARDSDNPGGLETVVNPGDAITVKKAGIVYVLGAVNRPGGYVMQEAGRLNALEAVSLAYGVAPQAASGTMKILRKQPNGMIAEIPFEYGKAKKGALAPLPLQAEDVLFVPSSKIKAAFIDSKSVISSAASASIYLIR